MIDEKKCKIKNQLKETTDKKMYKGFSIIGTHFLMNFIQICSSSIKHAKLGSGKSAYGTHRKAIGNYDTYMEPCFADILFHYN